jgi:hypothetical protein
MPSLKRLLFTVASIAKGMWITISGAILSFTVQKPKPLKECEIGIDPVQDLHGQESPYPAGGGKNQFYCDSNKTATLNGVTCSFDASTQEFTISGTNESSSAYVLLYILPTSEIPRNVALSSAFIGIPNGVYMNFVYYDGSWHSINQGGMLPDSVSLSNVRIQVGVYGSAGDIPTKKFKCQIEQGSTAPTAWTPYSNICPISGWTGCNVSVSPTTDPDDPDKEVYTYTFPTEAGTVYGGNLTIHQDGTGTLVVDRAYALLNDPDKWVSASGNIKYKYTDTFTDRKIFDNSYSGLNCSYIRVNSNYASNTARWGSATTTIFGLAMNDLTLTLTDIKADAEAGKISIVYDLATPVTYQLTNQQVIETLKGVNNVWADTGNIEITYWGSDE